MPTTAPTAVERAASVLVGIEAVALAALAIWQIVALVSGDTDSLASSIALIVLTVLAVAAVAAFARAIAVDQSWGRSGAVVTQLLVLAVALGSATGAYAHPLIGLAIAVPALIVLVVVIAATRASAARRPRDESGR